MSATVHLHIGEPKTGTTYVQAMLFHNQDRLLERGLFVPGRNLDHIRGGHEVLGRTHTAGTHATTGAWGDIASMVDGSSALNAVVSMEMMTRARSRQARHACDAFASGTQVRVIITVRELGRLAPARWQESVQFRRSWRLDDYLQQVLVEHPRSSGSDASRHFWRLHDTPMTVRTWANVVGPSNVTLVTVPGRNAPPEELWQRFGRAMGVDVAGCEAAESANTSLGATSAELMRRVNEALVDSDLGDAEHARICRRFLAKTVLAARKGAEPPIALPRRFAPAARQLSEQIVGELAASGVEVVGDLDDLVPSEGAADLGPLDVPADDLTQAAVEAVAALVEQNAQLAKVARRRGADLPFTELE